MTRREPLSLIQPEIGCAFTARTSRPDLSAHRRPSLARVLEDGRPLPGPANALHDDIRHVGRGHFSFWHNLVYFATSDNSDPRTNGRRYEIEYPIDRATACLLRLKNAVTSKRKTASAVGRAGYGADVLLRMWERIGCAPSRDSRLLDFGCGAGERVDELRRKGHEAFGCDLSLPEPVRGSGERGIIREITTAPYRIPFDDQSFDVVFSITVFEHVMNYDAALAEISRVLKPGGVAVHVFPSRWKPLETHAFVPFASRVQSYWWLYFWALLGVRNEFQRGDSATFTATANHRFLTNETNYLSKRRIRQHVLRHFDECEFVEEAAFRPERYEFFRRHPRLLPPYRAWSSATNVRVLVCRARSASS